MVEKTEYLVPDFIISLIQIQFINDADEPIRDTEFKIVFQDNQEIIDRTNAEGLIRFRKWAEGEINVILQEEDETNNEETNNQSP